MVAFFQAYFFNLILVQVIILRDKYHLLFLRLFTVLTQPIRSTTRKPEGVAEGSDKQNRLMYR